MSEAPEKLFCWNFQTKEGGWEKGWGGYCRKSNLRPLDDRELNTGALYTRTDLIPAMVEAVYRMAFEDAAKIVRPKIARSGNGIAVTALHMTADYLLTITPPSDLVERVKDIDKTTESV